MYKKILILGLVIFSPLANSIAVSSLLEAADPDTRSAEITIANNDGKDMFVNFQMSKVEYIDGKKVVTKVSKDNISDWTFSISPSQMILRPGEQRVLRMINNCYKHECNNEIDETYAVDITPVPYIDGKASSVSVAFGYRVYFIDPASNVKLDYKIYRKDKKNFQFTNNSNTMLNAVINYCKYDFKTECIYQNRLLPGSSKTFSLPPEAWEKKSIKANIINANEEINEQVYF
ncbi:pilus assembly protein [Vibrio hepatarius]|uniref:pilus assembly protein n=1 Tax=Vibrio hepatarius TaxID=171383 RepID=UPI003735BC7A